MTKVYEFFLKIMPSKRKLIQLYSALLHNAHLKGFVTGKIFDGPLKNICGPGFNCYSCPGATTACPLGSIQNALAESKTKTPTYVFGIILLISIYNNIQIHLLNNDYSSFFGYSLFEVSVSSVGVLS